MNQPRTLYEKVIDQHRVRSLNDLVGPGEQMLLYIDRTVLNEYTSPQAFSGLRAAGRSVFRPRSALGVVDHVNSTAPNRTSRAADSQARAQIEYFIRNGVDFGIEIFDVFNRRQGIEHVVLPELGLVLPGLVIAAGDSHTTTYGAFGAVGFGIGTSDIEHLLATQTLRYTRLGTMRATVVGELPIGVSAKDIVMALISQIGASGAAGYALEIAGPAIEMLEIEARMTVCNMAVECGARVALIAPDEKVLSFIAGKPRAPSKSILEHAAPIWTKLRSDAHAKFDREVRLLASDIAPMVTWGTSPDQAAAIDAVVPDPAVLDPQARHDAERALKYMDLMPGTALSSVMIDRAFIGSCTNSRLSDLREAAAILKGRRVAPHVRAMVSPGSSTVRREAEREGLDRIFIEAGFEWRESGCSMCLAMNDDVLKPGERCASSTNRNFEGRQGKDGRTHLMSPAMVAAAAVCGRLTDVRTLTKKGTQI